MKPIWQIDSADVKGLQGRDQDFTQFVNDLLQHQAAAAHLASAALQLNLAVHNPDGGVDAAVTQPIAAQFDSHGYFGVPTCWQFRACPTRNIKRKKGKKSNGGQEGALRSEIRKPEVAKRIANGYGYRLCIADDLAPELKSQWEEWLFDEAKKVARTAPSPKVLTAHDLANWANGLVGVILPFRPYLGAFQSLRTWGSEITSETPHFVLVAAWEPGTAAIREHANLSKPCSRVILTIQGEAGVGKTRCAYEALCAAPENHARVLYTRNEVEAERIANLLANDPRFCAIIVADECVVQARVDLERRLQPHSDRIRVIAIDNSLQSKPRGTGEIHLERLSDSEVEKILDEQEQFRLLSWERRHAFVRLSGGFVRLALDLCRQAHLIPPEGAIGSVVGFFREHYLEGRLSAQDREVVEAVALLPRVGYKADIRQQLEWLCQATGLQPDRVLQTAARLKQAPGFIAFGERYLYITPQLIRQAAFQAAWARWIEPDPESFFRQRLPGEMIDGFADQLRDCGDERMGRVFADFFRGWTSRLTGRDLADEAMVSRLVRLVEAEPQTLLPMLRRLVEATDLEELRQLPTHNTSRRWPVRRELVWLADKFLRLPEHFEDAERILWRLALAETEVYANNATGVWKGIFRPLLSGTPVALAARLKLLKHRFEISNEAQIGLCLQALGETLENVAPIMGRPLGPPVVAGKIPPSDWYPKNAQESRECWTSPLGLFKDLTHSQNPKVREGVRDTTIAHVSSLLRHGFLADVVEILGQEPLSDTHLARLLERIDWFLEVHCDPRAKHISAELEKAIREWRQRLTPQSLHGQLVAVVGQEPWRLGVDGESRSEREITALAQQLVCNYTALHRELDWLLSGKARSGVRLGKMIGRLDTAGEHLDLIVSAAAPTNYPGFARGYVQGLAQHHPEQIDRINQMLDRFQKAHPRAILDMASSVDALRPFERMLAMIDANLLPMEFLREVEFTVGHRPLQVTELKDVLARLTIAVRSGDSAAAAAAVHVMWRALCPVGEARRVAIHEQPWIMPVLREFLGSAIPRDGNEAYAWVQLVELIGMTDPTSALDLAVRAAAGDSITVAEQALEVIQKFVKHRPQEVMNLLGSALLDASAGWRLETRQIRGLIAAIPFQIVTEWLERHGPAGALALAHNLPLPHLDDGENPVVPELTAYVLDRYRDDDRVFSRFCIGVHNGKLYTGDIAGEHDRESQVARHFLDHPLDRIREWAQYEIDRAVRDAAWWRAHDEELATS